jgi:hypothetical protein
MSGSSSSLTICSSVVPCARPTTNCKDLKSRSSSFFCMFISAVGAGYVLGRRRTRAASLLPLGFSPILRAEYRDVGWMAA